MKEIKANFAEQLEMDRKTWDGICVTTNTTIKQNGELVMGAGIAKIMKEFWPVLPKIWGRRLKNSEHVDGVMAQYDDCFKRYVISFPTKEDWKLDSTLHRIIRSLEILVPTVKILGLKKILLPRPGCSNGGLEWNKVKPILENRLDDRYTVISRG